MTSLGRPTLLWMSATWICAAGWLSLQGHLPPLGTTSSFPKARYACFSVWKKPRIQDFWRAFLTWVFWEECSPEMHTFGGEGISSDLHISHLQVFDLLRQSTGFAAATIAMAHVCGSHVSGRVVTMHVSRAWSAEPLLHFRDYGWISKTNDFCILMFWFTQLLVQG